MTFLKKPQKPEPKAETPKLQTCYLAGPFKNLEVSEAVKLHKESAAFLVTKGYSPYSPILNVVPTWLETKDEISTPWWEPLERPLIQSLDFLVIIVKPQTFFSEGTQRELTYAIQYRKPIKFLLPTPSQTFVLIDAVV